MIGDLLLMTLIMSRLQGRELKPFSCKQVQDHLRFIDFTSERQAYLCFLFVSSFYESHVRILRDDRKIKFRMVSAQHFINEAPGPCVCTQLSRMSKKLASHQGVENADAHVPQRGSLKGRTLY